MALALVAFALLLVLLLLILDQSRSGPATVSTEQGWASNAIAFGTLLATVAIGFFAFRASTTANKIAETQRDQALTAKRTDDQLRAIDLLFSKVETENDVRRIEAAFDVISATNPDAAIVLVSRPFSTTMPAVWNAQLATYLRGRNPYSYEDAKAVRERLNLFRNFIGFLESLAAAAQSPSTTTIGSCIEALQEVGREAASNFGEYVGVPEAPQWIAANDRASAGDLNGAMVAIQPILEPLLKCVDRQAEVLGEEHIPWEAVVAGVHVRLQPILKARGILDEERLNDVSKIGEGEDASVRYRIQEQSLLIRELDGLRDEYNRALDRIQQARDAYRGFAHLVRTSVDQFTEAHSVAVAASSVGGSENRRALANSLLRMTMAGRKLEIIAPMVE